MGFNLQRYIPRRLEADLHQSLQAFPVTALLGPRQCGKSTLARRIVQEYPGTIYLDLEKPSDQRKIRDAEFYFQTPKDHLNCIDEIQMGPELFPTIRVMVDEDRRPGKFLILGSASQELIHRSSETLAGRIQYLELSGLSYDELIEDDPETFADPLLPWSRGGFPDAIMTEACHTVPPPPPR